MIDHNCRSGTANGQGTVPRRREVLLEQPLHHHGHHFPAWPTTLELANSPKRFVRRYHIDMVPLRLRRTEVTLPRMRMARAALNSAT